MPSLIVTLRSKENRTPSAEVGSNLVEMIRNGGVGEFLALFSCASCLIYVDPTFENPMRATGAPLPEERVEGLLAVELARGRRRPALRLAIVR